MCVPIAALAVASMGMQAAGSVIGAYGQYQSGKADEATANYRGAVAQNNASIMGQNAQYAEKVGAVEAENRQFMTGRMVGAGKAAMAAAGVDTSSGTPASITADTAKMGDLDVQTIRNNAARVAYGYRVNEMGYTAEAALDSAAARNARRAGNLGVASSLIGGASSVGKSWAGFQMAGAM